MTTVIFDRKEFEKYVKLDKETVEKISLFGTPLEKINKDVVEIEVFPNRPDLISIHGFMRGFKAFLGKEVGLKKYKVNPPQKDYFVEIDKSVKSVRPHTACAIVKGIKFDDGKIKDIINLQEKLHITIGRNRKKVAIGVYPLEKIKLPIKFEARDPSKIKFVPLEAGKVMNGYQILEQHPTGKEYAHLLKGKDTFPVFVDANNSILSMPPIINSDETGRITNKTKDVFVECSGFDFEVLKKTLNIIVTTLADMGGEIYAMKLKDAKETTTPDLSTETMNISLMNANKLLGLNLKESDLKTLLPKMGYEYSSGSVKVPAWRTDVLHEVDVIEDIAIAYGYDKLEPEIPSVATAGEESDESKFKTTISNILTGIGLYEISTYHLLKAEEINKDDKNKIELENSKTDYKFLRNNLLVPALRILSENKSNEYPQNLFEIGTVFSLDKSKKSDTGINENESLCGVLCAEDANFTKIRQVLDYLFRMVGVNYEILPEIKDKFIDGRTGKIIVNGMSIGVVGEIHPKTLIDVGINVPVAVFELNLTELFEILKKNNNK